jgi:predicted nucleic acid-binding protein
MSDKHFVDTNILMYAHDSTAGAKHDRAKAVVEQLWQERTGTVSTQVLQELAVNLRRKVTAPLTAKAVQEIVADYLTWHVVVNDGAAILEALDFEERYRISFWDALIVHAAHASGANVLYSEDLSDGQHYGSVRVENPLVDHVHESGG